MLGGWCCGAIIILSIREVGSIVKYDVRVTFASGTVSGVNNVYGYADPFF